jgi:hypothetical protein
LKSARADGVRKPDIFIGGAYIPCQHRRFLDRVMERQRNKMPRPEDIKFDDLPDAAVVSVAYTSALLGVSTDTLKRMHQRGELPRTQISVKRIGHTAGSIRALLKNRTPAAA